MDAIILTCNQTPDYTIQRYLGPYKIANILRQNGYDCAILDFIHNDTVKEEFTWEINNFLTTLNSLITKDTIMIGFSLTFWRNYSSYYYLKNYIKNNYPHCKIVVGGGFNVVSQNLLNDVDAWIRGYGEDIILQLMNHWKFNQQEPHYIISLEQRVKEYGSLNYQSEFTNCNFTWSNLDKIQNGESLPIELSRGCIFKCKFCNFPNLGKRKRDYIRDSTFVKLEIEKAYYNFNTTFFQIIDDTFNETPDKVQTFMNDIKSLKLNVNFGSFIRCDLLARYPETIDYLEEGQIASVAFGIETLHPVASKIIGKGWNGTKECVEFLTKLAKRWNNKINIHCYMISGLPGESEKELFENRQRLIDTGISSFNYYPLTITRNRTATMLSEFERNYENYGFKFVGDIEWINEKYNWTYKQAVDLSKELMTLNNPRSWMKTENWRMHRYITTKVATVNDLVTKSNSEINHLLYRQKADEWLDAYYKSWN